MDLRRCLVIIAVFVIILTNPEQLMATVDWIRSESVTSPYEGRVYSHAHWTSFYLNETQFNAPAKGESKGSMYASVFTLPSADYNLGYTAIGNNDYSDASNGNQIQEFVRGVGLGKYNVNQYDCISPAFLAQKLSRSTRFNPNGNLISTLPIAPEGECIQDVSIIKQNYSGELKGRYTVEDNNPYCHQNSDSSFIARIKDGSKGWEWTAQNPGIIKVTKEYAMRMFNSPNTTRAEIRVSYPYGVGLSSLVRTAVGKSKGDTEGYRVSIINTTPYTAKDVNLRAYIKANGKYQLVKHEKVNVPATDLFSADGTMGQQNWEFSYALPEDNFDVVVTANIDIPENGSYKNYEPLKTNYAFGSKIGQEYADKNELGSSLYPGQNPYGDNILQQGLTGGIAPEKKAQLYDLIAESAQVLDSNNNPVFSVEAGRDIQVKATFRSNFPQSGNATLRLYRMGSNFELLHTTPVFFEAGPGRVLNYKWPSITVSSPEEYSFFITIDILPDGSHELFDGKYDESNWDNNATITNISGTSIPTPNPPPPPPSMYFPEWTDGHWERRTVTKDIQGWQEVRVNLPEPAKIKVRLVR